jgi:phosphoribosylanthranilate isomerase
MPIDVKICGLKTRDEIDIVNQFPISYAGFIFAPSKRQVTTRQAKELMHSLRKDIKKVGVFVNSPIEEVLRAVKACKLDVIQLHGDESVDYIQQIPCKVWKTISMKDASSLKQVELYGDVVDGLLFETHHEGMRGGSGKAFDWSLLEKRPKLEASLILAGGLSPENIGQAIDMVKPDVVDVNSGLEVNGYKSYERIKKLFEELNL